jgi:hypothetical protein
MFVPRGSPDYTICLILNYIEDVLFPDWCIVMDDVYEKISKKALEVEKDVLAQLQDINVENDKYCNFKKTVDSLFASGASVYNFCNALAFIGLLAKEIVANNKDICILKHSIQRYVVESHLSNWVFLNLSNFRAIV